MAARRLGTLCLCVRIFPKNGPKIGIFGQKWPKNGVFRRFLTIFRLRGPLRLVSVDDFLSEAYARTGKARISCNKVE